MRAASVFWAMLHSSTTHDGRIQQPIGAVANGVRAMVIISEFIEGTGNKLLTGEDCHVKVW
jgi:hypothetical protein